MPDNRPRVHWAPLARIVFTIAGVINIGGLVGSLLKAQPYEADLALATANFAMAVALAARWPRKATPTRRRQEGRPGA